MNRELYKFVKKFYRYKLQNKALILKNKAIEKEKLYLLAQNQNDRKRSLINLEDGIKFERKKYCDLINDYINLYNKGLNSNSSKEDFQILNDYFLNKLETVGFKMINLIVGTNLLDVNSDLYNVYERGEEKTKILEIIESGYTIFNKVYKTSKIKTN